MKNFFDIIDLLKISLNLNKFFKTLFRLNEKAKS